MANERANLPTLEIGAKGDQTEREGKKKSSQSMKSCQESENYR